jgi:hypothetical protein
MVTHRLTLEIQEYISKSLLLDPSDVVINGSTKPTTPTGHKVKMYSFCCLTGDLTTTSAVSSSSVLCFFGRFAGVSLHPHPSIILGCSVCGAWVRLNRPRDANRLSAPSYKYVTTRPSRRRWCPFVRGVGRLQDSIQELGR